MFLLFYKSTNRGNFLEVLNWAAATDPIVKSIVDDSSSNATYSSPQVQNELIHILADETRKQISLMVSQDF